MFLSRTRQIKEPPPKPSSKKAPRIKPPKYVYKLEEDTSITQIVMSITNGLLIKQIQPELYPMIIPYLRIKREHLIQDRNLYAVKTLDKAIDDIEDYYIKEERKREQKRQRELAREAYEAQKAREEEERRKNQNRFTPQEIEANTELALSGNFDKIDPRIYKAITAELRKRHHRAVKEENYKYASSIDSASKRVTMLDNELKYGEMVNKQVKNYADKVDNLRNEFYEIKYEWKERIAEAKRQRDEDIKDLKEQIDISMKEFDLQYDMEVPLQYKKYSANYLDMRVKERNLMNSKRFEEAHEMKELADKRQAEEEKYFRDKYHADLELRRNDYIKKIQDKIYVRLENSEMSLLQMEREADREIDHIKKALKRYEMHKTEAEQFAAVINPTAPNSARRNRNTRDSQRSQRIKDLKTPRSFQEEQNHRDTFRQRRAINNLMYSKLGIPQVKKVQKREY